MSQTGLNMEKVKRQNRALILRSIYESGPISRKDIAAQTGLTPASVTQITTALIADGLLEEIGTAKDRPGAAGRRKILLDVCPDAAWILAVNIEPRTTVIAVCNMKGELPEKDHDNFFRTIPTQKEIAPEAYLTQIAQICREMLAGLSESARGQVKAVSVGITGVTDDAEGLSTHAYNVWNEPVDVRGILGKELGLPVFLKNNVYAFATAELLFGDGRNGVDLFIVKWGPGVGSAIISDGRLYKGRMGKSAELGHVVVKKNGDPCICGRRGCLETLISYSALSKLMDFGPNEFGQRYADADAETRSRIDEAIGLFAQSIVNAGTLLAPGHIILCGELFIDERIRERLISFCAACDASFGEERIRYTSLSDRERFIGQVAVFIQETYL